MAKPNLVEDVTRAARLAKRVLTGDMSIADVLTNRNPARPAHEGEARCEITPGCVGPVNHQGGCILDAEQGEAAR